MSPSPSPVTLEVVRHAVLAIAEEMSAIVMRSARSPLLKEAGDLSSALTDARGRLIAQGKDIPIHLHPNVPPGTILFYTDVFPYPLSNVSNVIQYRLLRDYYQIEWPLRTRRYEYGVYLHTVLQNYFPPAFMTLSGIGNG